MSDANKPFDFSQFVPGFDFLKNLASGSAAAGAAPGTPNLASWVAPTLSVEEVDKRIRELKTVLFWLEQNGHALKATIQALEVQKMTLSTLRGMNVRMEDLASVFARQPAPTPKPHPKEADAPSSAKPSGRAAHAEAGGSAASNPQAAGVVDPLQWWGALTQQFQQIAGAALQEASKLKMPAMAPDGSLVKGPAKAAPAAGSKPAARGRSATAAGKSPARKRTR